MQGKAVVNTRQLHAGLRTQQLPESGSHALPRTCTPVSVLRWFSRVNMAT